ncbi:GNAT family N-acetyltransferase [Allokutzneria sp. A3M-2-11 16]|uniref:GNAT family N-acetyltransferase n=1 Tax=Allokutzneria sp. A3M-2-11 16 TaxID=2962043 RepID=UPI0020B67918|nr:N-acetyltransferase [Allokutzneria sp. A3M-2-11 16]MCP3805046.1 GNAT family N-acetyltransferase [Allokutzneria sp. A3M-2-11 16]
MITMARGDELGERSRMRIADVLVRGFAQDFSFFSKDSRALADAFAHMLLLDRFHVACVDGEPAAVATLTSGTQQCFAPRWGPFRKHLGWVRGTVCYHVIRNQFMAVSEGAAEDVAEIGFVTTAPEHQGRGVATALLRHLVAQPGPRAFVLEEIKDTNEPALGLYRKLGFTEYRRRPQKHTARVGFEAYVSMRLDVT